MEHNTLLAPAVDLAPERAADVADLIVLALEALGVDYVFGVPGGAIEPLYNALARSGRRGGPKAVVARNEQGAAYMADGYARETGKLGVCIATSGPGATNLITGVACAHDNGVPLLVITGQPQIRNFGRGALQESSCTGIDTMAMFSACTRYNSLVSHAEQLPTKLFNAIMQARHAPGGPSHLSIPVDILRQPLPDDLEMPDFTGLLRSVPALVDLPAVQQLATLLRSARRPVWVIGEGCGEAISELMQIVQWGDGHFIATPDGKGLINPRHLRFRGVFGFGGHACAAELLAGEPDLIVALGTSFGELNSGGWSKSLLNSRLVHVDDSDERLMRTPTAKLHVRGHIKTICEQLLALLAPPDAAPAGQLLPFQHPQASRKTLESMVDKPEMLNQDSGPVKPQRLLAALGDRCTPRTRFVADAGSSAVWAVHYLAPCDQRGGRAPGGADAAMAGNRRRRAACWLRVTMNFAPMGWAIGSAVGIAAANRRCPVVCLTGDGSYLMNGQEITVAAELGLTVLYVVLNDSALGMVKHGQRLAGAEPIGFELPKVDYAAMAVAMGIPGHVIHTPQDLDALDFDALQSRSGPTLLDVRIDGEEVPPMNLRMKTLGSAR
ncbi:thiamine pyrophosphate-binding protein [Roseateles sp. BYS96W]|uniref:Thiamine pyrophosphate-binding protein n=1 Tax=Pelomonas nitida TaxID=3299027 RepID=A0ABW7G7Y1_9BURK